MVRRHGRPGRGLVRRCTPGVTGLLGHNGAGKSTALEALRAASPTPSTGTVRVLGRRPAAGRRGLPPHRHRAGHATASGRSSRAREMVELPGAPARRARSREAAAERALARSASRTPPTGASAGFSKGMRQRVKLAQALVARPRGAAARRAAQRPRPRAAPPRRRADPAPRRGRPHGARLLARPARGRAHGAARRRARQRQLVAEGETGAHPRPHPRPAAHACASRPPAARRPGTARELVDEGLVTRRAHRRRRARAWRRGDVDALGRRLPAASRATSARRCERVEPLGDDLESVYTYLDRPRARPGAAEVNGRALPPRAAPAAAARRSRLLAFAPLLCGAAWPSSRLPGGSADSRGELRRAHGAALPAGDPAVPRARDRSQRDRRGARRRHDPVPRVDAAPAARRSASRRSSAAHRRRSSCLPAGAVLTFTSRSAPTSRRRPPRSLAGRRVRGSACATARRSRALVSRVKRPVVIGLIYVLFWEGSIATFAPARAGSRSAPTRVRSWPGAAGGHGHVQRADRVGDHEHHRARAGRRRAGRRGRLAAPARRACPDPSDSPEPRPVGVLSVRCRLPSHPARRRVPARRRPHRDRPRRGRRRARGPRGADRDRPAVHARARHGTDAGRRAGGRLAGRLARPCQPRALSRRGRGRAARLRRRRVRLGRPHRPHRRLPVRLPAGRAADGLAGRARLEQALLLVAQRDADAATC